MGTRPEKVDSRGFTLLELIVVFFLIGLATTLAAPAIGRSIDLIRVRAEVAGFSALLRYAREQAITSGRAHSFVVDLPAHRVSVAADGDVKRTRALPSSWTVEAVPAQNLTMRFDPYGTSSGGEYRLLAGIATYRITVDALTGRVRSARE